MEVSPSTENTEVDKQMYTVPYDLLDKGIIKNIEENDNIIYALVLSLDKIITAKGEGFANKVKSKTLQIPLRNLIFP